MALPNFDPIPRSDELSKSRRRGGSRSEWIGSTVNPEAESGLPDQNNNSLDEDLRRQMLAYAQRHDIQTGLLNYQAFQESLGWLLKERQESQEVVLLWIDILNLRKEFSL